MPIVDVKDLFVQLPKIGHIFVAQREQCLLHETPKAIWNLTFDSNYHWKYRYDPALPPLVNGIPLVEGSLSQEIRRPDPKLCAE